MVAKGWRKRRIAMMHITKTWFEDGKMITENIPTEHVYKQKWQGLTYEEQEEIILSSHSIRDAINRTDWKLKEKNT